MDKKYRGIKNTQQFFKPYLLYIYVKPKFKIKLKQNKHKFKLNV